MRNVRRLAIILVLWSAEDSVGQVLGGPAPDSAAAFDSIIESFAKLRGTSDDPWALKGETYRAQVAMRKAFTTGDWKEVERNARVVLVHTPEHENDWALRSLGIAQAAQGRCKDALTSFAAAMFAHGPSTWAEYYSNSMWPQCLEAQGSLPEALTGFRRALAAEWRFNGTAEGKPKLPFTPTRAWLESRIDAVLARMNAAAPNSAERWLGDWRSAYGTRLVISPHAEEETTSGVIQIQVPTTYGCQAQAVVGALENSLTGSIITALVGRAESEPRECRLSLKLSDSNAHIEVSEDSACYKLREARCSLADKYERVRR